MTANDKRASPFHAKNNVVMKGRSDDASPLYRDGGTLRLVQRRSRRDAGAFLGHLRTIQRDARLGALVPPRPSRRTACRHRLRHLPARHRERKMGAPSLGDGYALYLVSRELTT